MSTELQQEYPDLAQAWSTLQQRHPLVLCITNRVTPQRVADTLLAAGASPVMADNPLEIEQMARIADAIYINTGIHETQVASLKAAACAFRSLSKPYILDPVGAGATDYRTGLISDLLRHVPFAAIRGNASEIRSLAGATGTTRGVDSSDSSESALEAAVSLSRNQRCTVGVSGETDLVVPPSGSVSWVRGGHPWTARITGSGCSLGALCAALVATAGDVSDALLAAHAAFKLASTRAAQTSRGPGTFSVHFLDELAALSTDDLANAEIDKEVTGEYVG